MVTQSIAEIDLRRPKSWKNRSGFWPSRNPIAANGRICYRPRWLMYQRIIIITICCLISQVASAHQLKNKAKLDKGDWELVKKAWSNHQPRISLSDELLAAVPLKELERLATLGDPNMQYLVGLLYDQGELVPFNAITALRWYELAAAQSHPYALHNAAVLHLKGTFGVPLDSKTGVAYLEKSAKLGYDYALCTLGHVYRKSFGAEEYYANDIPKDYDKAFELYREAYLKKEPAAWGALGSILYFDYHDLEKSSAVLDRIMKLPIIGDLIAKKKTHKPWNYHYIKAFELFEKGAELGCSQSCEFLYYIYKGGGDLGKKDDVKAFEIINRSFELGNHSASWRIAQAYESGIGVKRDPKLAFKWHQISARRVQENGLLGLANCYLYGIGCKKNPKKALQLMKNSLTKVRPQSRPYINYRIGQIYYWGYKGIPMNRKTTAKYLEKKPMHARSHYLLATLYHKGMGVDIDFKKAIHHYNESTLHPRTAHPSSGVVGMLEIYFDQGLTHDLSELEEKAKRNSRLTKNAPKQAYIRALLYEHGAFGFAQNNQLALDCYRNAYSDNYQAAGMRLYKVYRNGELGLTKDPAEAKKILIAMAEKKHLIAYLTLAMEYEKGEIIKQNYAKARENYKKAMRYQSFRGLPEYRTALHFKQGLGIKKNPAEARKWMLKAAKLGNEDAKLAISRG